MNSIGNLYQQLRNRLHEAHDDTRARHAQIELSCYTFCIKDGALEPLYSRLDEKNEKHDWPPVNDFEVEDPNYLETRLENATNPIVKARYAHALFAAARHNRFASIAIESYFAAIPLHVAQDHAHPQAKHGLRITESLLAAARISISASGSATGDIVARMLQNIGLIARDSSIRRNAVLSVSDFVYDNRKKISAPHLSEWHRP